MAAFAALSFSTLYGCKGKFEYDLKRKSPEQPAAAKNTGNSWWAKTGEFLLPLIEDDDTVYAVGYSEKIYDSLDLGLTQEEIIRVLGPPLRKEVFFEDEIYWYYSRPGPQFKSYFVRILVFDGNSRLIAKRWYFYMA